jgi:hypothetical protein
MSLTFDIANFKFLLIIFLISTHVNTWAGDLIFSEEERVPYLVIDPIEFENGEIKIDGPTHIKQIIRY